MSNADVNAIVRELLVTEGNSDAAAKALLARAEGDAELYKAIVNGHMAMLCSQIVNKIVRVDRNIIVSRAELTKTSDVTAWANAVTEGLMDYFRLPGGKLLGQAVKADLIAGASAYDIQVGDMLVKAKWLRLLARQMPDEVTTVSKAMTEVKVKALKDEAKKVATSSTPKLKAA